MAGDGESGWKAECQDCPTTTNEDWGHQERVGKKCAGSYDAHLWRACHRADHPEHRVTVSRYCTINFTVSERVGAESPSRIFGD